jgi:alkylation response protein AidB-like acyl-CoA dehydrogenase
MLDISVQYAKDREQFGKHIGAFQAVAHRCAQMALEAESARSAVLYAAWCADAEPASLPMASSAAKAYASDAGWRVPHQAIQTLGGIGFTWEHAAHLFLRRGRVNAELFGSSAAHRERIAAALLDDHTSMRANDPQVA